MQTTPTVQTRPAIVPTSVDHARILAGIAERALTLFSTDGYRAQQFESNPAMFFVFPPEADKLPYVVDTLPGREHCTCPAHAKWEVCKHRLAVEAEIEAARIADEQADELAAYQTFGRFECDEEADDADRQAQTVYAAA